MVWVGGRGGTWYIIDDEEVEAEVDRIKEDEEVARIYEDAKDKHRKIMTSGFKSNTVL